MAALGSGPLVGGSHLCARARVNQKTERRLHCFTFRKLQSQLWNTSLFGASPQREVELFAPPRTATMPDPDPATNSTDVVEAPYLRSTVSRFGGMVAQGHTVSIPTKAFAIQQQASGEVDHANFNSRYQANLTTFCPGVPGYTGFKPHGSATMNMNPHAYISGMHDPSEQPRVMPPPGYAGHLRSAKAGDSPNAWGTSHWRPTNNKHGVATPARSPPKAPALSPELEAERREAEEANELLELRSLGIRGSMANASPHGGGVYNF